MTILEIINSHMNGGGCPATPSLGECAAIGRITGHGGHSVFVAHLCLLPAAADLKPSDVAAWFKSAGCDWVTVSALLHDPENETLDGITSDGVRPWEVCFQISDLEKRGRLGL